MAALVNTSYVQASTNLATDLARYGSSADGAASIATRRSAYTVSQTIAGDDGLGCRRTAGCNVAARPRRRRRCVRPRVDRAFALRSFEFSLDPGTGAIASAAGWTRSASTSR
jgi:hypothetical protein